MVRRARKARALALGLRPGSVTTAISRDTDGTRGRWTRPANDIIGTTSSGTAVMPRPAATRPATAPTLCAWIVGPGVTPMRASVDVTYVEMLDSGPNAMNGCPFRSDQSTVSRCARA